MRRSYPTGPDEFRQHAVDYEEGTDPQVGSGCARAVLVVVAATLLVLACLYGLWGRGANPPPVPGQTATPSTYGPPAWTPAADLVGSPRG